MDKALDAGLARQAGEPRRPGVVHPIEALRPALAQDADAIDQRLVASEEGRQHLLVVDCQIQRRDLPDITERHQKPGALGAAAADGDHIAARGQPLHDVAADKARPAQDRAPAISHRSPGNAPPALCPGAGLL